MNTEGFRLNNESLFRNHALFDIYGSAICYFPMHKCFQAFEPIYQKRRSGFFVPRRNDPDTPSGVSGFCIGAGEIRRERCWKTCRRHVFPATRPSRKRGIPSVVPKTGIHAREALRKEVASFGAFVISQSD